MAESSSSFHESADLLSPSTMERHRAISSLREELEAIDWYDQRIDATTDDALRDILRHNRDEEKEHAVMALEWLRRHDDVLDRYLREHLFTEDAVVDSAELASAAGLGEAGAAGGASASDGDADGRVGASLGIGPLRQKPSL
jgi:ferritin-like protein